MSSTTSTPKKNYGAAISHVTPGEGSEERPAKRQKHREQEETNHKSIGKFYTVKERGLYLVIFTSYSSQI